MRKFSGPGGDNQVKNVLMAAWMFLLSRFSCFLRSRHMCTIYGLLTSVSRISSFLRSRHMCTIYGQLTSVYLSSLKKFLSKTDCLTHSFNSQKEAKTKKILIYIIWSNIIYQLKYPKSSLDLVIRNPKSSLDLVIRNPKSSLDLVIRNPKFGASSQFLYCKSLNNGLFQYALINIL